MKAKSEFCTRMTKKTALLFCLCLFLLACAPAIRVNHFPGARVYPPVNPQSVELLRSEPRRPHEAFAEIRFSPPRGMSRLEADLKLKEKGASIGADALVVEVDNVYREQVWVGPYRHHRGRRVHRRVVRDRVLVAVAIRYQR